MPASVPNRNHVGSPQAAVVGTPRTVPIKQLRANPWNYNTQGEETFLKLANSIRQFGFTQPIVCRTVPGVQGWEIVNGEHRWKAAQILAMTEVPIHDLGPIDDPTAKQLAIVLNELGGAPDQVRLADLLADISQTVDIKDLQAVMPFTNRELDMYLDAVDFSFDSAPTGDTRPPAEKDEAKAAAAAEDPDGQEAADRAGVKDPAPAEPPETPDKRRLVFVVPSDQYDGIVAALDKLDKDHNAAFMVLLNYYSSNVPPPGPVTERKKRGKGAKA